MKTNTFFYNTLIIGIIALYFGGCSVKNQENEIFNSTYDKFHGRYKIIKSTASEPTDMNFDGKKFDDLIKEIIDLQNSILQLNIYKGNLLFKQFWQEPAFPKTYDYFLLFLTLKIYLEITHHKEKHILLNSLLIVKK